MKIFVGFGYNPDDEWIKELVFPLLISFDIDIVTGEDMHGQILSEGVKERIATSKGLLAFRTRRDSLGNGKFTSHDWVRDELINAVSVNVPAVEIRDVLVDGQGGGMIGNRQRVDFDLQEKDKLLVEIAKIVSIWKKNLPKTVCVQLFPPEIAGQVRLNIANDNLMCFYSFRIGNQTTPFQESKPFGFKGGLFVNILDIPPGDVLVLIKLVGPDFIWMSDSESVENVSINLKLI
jgi:hypothetical protein